MAQVNSRSSPDLALAAAAEAAVQCLAIGRDDDVLVLFNEAQRAIADSLVAAAAGPARSVRKVISPTLSRDGEEPPERIGEAMRAATAILAPTVRSLSHTRARLAATRRGTRIATMPTITRETFVRCMSVDYDELGRAGNRLAVELSAAATCRITSGAGTDVLLSLEGRRAICDDGDLRARAAFGNLPAGEAFIAPVETSANGLVVFDGSLAGFGLLREPLRVTLVDGRIVGADGAAGEWLLGTLDSGGETGRVIAEIGIGTNPAAILTGTVLEDEKAIGTVHLAFGTNASFGGANVSDVHIDGVLLGPTLELDGRLLLRDGELLSPPGRT